MYQRGFTWMGVPAVLLAGFLVTSSTVKAADVQDSEEVSKLLSEAKTMAYQLSEDASTMESYTWNKVSWESHSTAISQVREHINALGRQATKLKEARDSASPWQKEAIDRIEPILKELADNTSAVINHLNGQHRRPLAEYQGYLEANAEHASDLSKMISDYIDYGSTKHKMDQFAEKLEIKP